MKTAMIGIFSAAVLLIAAGVAPGTAKAAGAGWWVEEGLGSSFDAPPAMAEEFHPGGAVETGRLPSGGESGIWVESEMGSSFDYLPDRGD